MPRSRASAISCRGIAHRRPAQSKTPSRRAEIAGTAGKGQARHDKAHFARCFGAAATIDTIYAVESQQAYYDFRVDERDSAAGTVARELHIFRSAIHTFHERRAALPSLPRIARVAGAGRARERWLLPEEVAALLAAASFPHLRLFIMLALETAARAGALVDAMWRQVDFAGRAINLSLGGPNEERAKRRVRVAIVTPGLLAELEYAHSVRRTDYVIEYGGFATPNVLRHTAATWMAKRGVPLKEIADYLGHTTCRMVEKHYAHHHPDWRQRAQAALGAELGALARSEAPALAVRRRRALLRAAARNAAETPQKHRRQKKGAGGQTANPLKNLVEPVGIEPTTSTMPL
jgi:integrase